MNSNLINLKICTFSGPSWMHCFLTALPINKLTFLNFRE